MTQQAGDGPATKPSQLREGYRLAMQQALLQTAVELVAEHGEDALTIKLVAEHFGSSIGTIYRFFRSKEALLDAVRDAQVEELVSAAQRAADRVERSLEHTDAPGPVAALARVVGASRFWIDAARASRHKVDRVLHQARQDGRGAERVLAPLTGALEAAADAAALTDGHSAARARLIVSIVPLPDDEQRLGGDPGGTDLGPLLLGTLLRAWGAPDEPLARAGELASGAPSS